MPAWLHDALGRFLGAPFDPDLRLYWGWLVGFGLVAAVVWFRGERRRHPERTLLGWLSHRDLWGRRSTRLDAKVLAAGLLLQPAKHVSGWFGVAAVGTWVVLGLDSLFPAWEGATWSGWMAGLYALLLLLANDFAMYWNHRLHHRVPALWAFHAVHHSADVLTPLTAYRKHPIYDATRTLLRALTAGPIQGLVAFAFAGQGQFLELLGINALWALFLAANSNLRHSRVPLRYGRVLGRILSSPSQHHLHHSSAPEHRDCNFATVFSLWDVLFDTLRLPTGDEQLRYGLPDGPSHHTLFDAWIRPFADSFQSLRRTS
jgi:sterol desaturase/sphingolipid hydroxylase (fatty acid hydroxylase superfamily)